MLQLELSSQALLPGLASLCLLIVGARWSLRKKTSKDRELPAWWSKAKQLDPNQTHCCLFGWTNRNLLG